MGPLFEPLLSILLVAIYDWQSKIALIHSNNLITELELVYDQRKCSI